MHLLGANKNWSIKKITNATHVTGASRWQEVLDSLSPGNDALWSWMTGSPPLDSRTSPRFLHHLTHTQHTTANIHAGNRKPELGQLCLWWWDIVCTFPSYFFFPAGCYYEARQVEEEFSESAQTGGGFQVNTSVWTTLVLAEGSLTTSCFITMETLESHVTCGLFSLSLTLSMKPMKAEKTIKHWGTKDITTGFSFIVLLVLRKSSNNF